MVAGEQHVDGGLNSGGRWFGRGWSSSERAAKIKLRWGLDYWVQERATDKAAGAGGGDLLEVPLVARRGVGE